LLQKVPTLGSDILIAVGEVILPDEIRQKSSDTELLRLARKGDSLAFRILVRRHDRYLYRVARSVLLNDQEAEDIVQETFIRAFTRLVSFRGESRLSTWLTRIPLNEARRRQRHRRRQLGLDVLDFFNSERDVQIPDFSASPVQDPERATAQDQIRMVLERAIDGLPETFRTVFVMREVEGLSTEETASALGILPQTVKTRLHRARRLLREALGEQVRANLKDAFPFERPRCDQLVGRLLDQLGLPKLPPDLPVRGRKAPA
jgi:RNA polymerase sigma-70 factor (ECF subfamily)